MAGINIRQVSKRKVGAILAGAAVFAIVSASAATLGGLQTNALGANSNTVTSPVENGVAIAWDTSYDQSAAAYVISGVELSTIDASESIPAGSEVKLTLTGADDAVLGEYVSTDGGATWASTPAATVTAHDVEGASVVINGGAVEAAVTGTD